MFFIFKESENRMIKIGIIDSGIGKVNWNGKSNIEGVYLKKDYSNKKIHFYENISDQIGHGDDCFKIISAIISDANYYIVKVFEKELATDIDVLAEAIQVCVDQHVDIINISAGVKADEMPELLRNVCDAAYDNDIIIVSAQHNQGLRCYPASYAKVIGVGTVNLVAGEKFRYVYNKDIEFYTSAADIFPNGAAWSQSTSFACAKITGYAAQILKHKGKLKFDQLKTELINAAVVCKNQI